MACLGEAFLSTIVKVKDVWDLAIGQDRFDTELHSNRSDRSND